MNNNFEERYELHIKQFCKDLQKYLEKTLLRNKVPVIITPSRKMARIFMWLKEKGYVSIPHQTIVLSEFAIAFSMRRIVKLYGERLNVIITDDIINSGQTSNNIATCVNSYTHQKPAVLPLLVSENNAILLYADLIYNGKMADKRFLEYFTTRNIENFISMGMPIDMEYPIIKINTADGQIKTGDFEKTLVRLFESCSIYPIRHTIKYNGKFKEFVYYTVLLDQNKDKQYSDSDFSKIRFFISDSNLTIEFYSPKTVDEHILNTPKQFRNESLKRIWDFVHFTEKTDIMSDIKQENVTLLNKTKSEIVFTNYLYSLVILKQNMVPLLKILEFLKEDKSSIKIDLYCLGLLVGHKKAEIIYPYMMNFLFSEKEVETEQHNLLYVLEKEETPDEYKDLYYQNNIIRLLDCHSIEEGISSIFNVQHLLTNNKTSFGESFSSLEDKLRICVSSEEINKDIHRCVDFMIDEAAITPFYMRINRNSHSYWKRMFCFGDGQHILDSFSKCVLYVFDKYMEMTKKTYVEKNEISSLIAMVFNNKVKTPYVFNLEGKKSVHHKVSHSEMYIENISIINVMDYLNLQNTLNFVDINGIKCYKNLSTEESRKVRMEVPFDEEQRKITDNLIYFFWEYSGKKIQKIRTMTLSSPISIFKEAFGLYISEIIELFEKAKTDTCSLNDMARHIQPMVNNLLIFIQSYDMYIIKGVPAFNNDDNEDVYSLWEKTFKTKSDVLYDEHLVGCVKKATIILLELFTLLYIFLFNDKEEADKTIKSMTDLNENGTIKLDEFSMMIIDGLYKKYSKTQIIDTYINLTRQFY